MDINTNNTNAVSSFRILWEQGANQSQTAQNQTSSTISEDSVRISNFPQDATLLSDDEATSVLNETVDTIKNDPHTAMFAHSGLDASRVAALLA